MISCKAEFENEPEHSEFISENDEDPVDIRCSGWRNPLNITLVAKRPFLMFYISDVFAIDLSDLSLIPHDIYVYGGRYRFGGATSHVSNRGRYVGYTRLNNKQIIFYVGLPLQIRY